MGYTGVALKACKGQSGTLLMAAAARKYRMVRCVQDLTCPGAALVQSVGIAAHVPGTAAVEADARQYVPAANAGWEAKFPGIFNVREGSATDCVPASRRYASASIAPRTSLSNSSSWNGSSGDGSNPKCS